MGERNDDCAGGPQPRRGRATYRDELPQWAREAVDRYVGELAGTAPPASLEYRSTCCSHFLRHLCEAGARSPSDVTASALLDYRRANEAGNTTCHCGVSAAKGVLWDLCGRGEVEPWAPMLMGVRLGPEGPRYEYGPGEWDGLDGTVPSREFLDAAGEFCRSALAAAGYSRSPRKAMSRALDEVYVFLGANGLSYGADLAYEWLGRNDAALGYRAGGCRRAVRLFEGWRSDGVVRADGATPRPGGPQDGLPGWAADALADYLELRRREGAAPSTPGRCRTSA